MALHSEHYLNMPKMSMKKPNLGFIQLSLMGWMAVGAAVVILGMGIALKAQTARLDAVKQEYAGFKAAVKANGDAAAIRAKQINEQNRLLKEWADADYERLLASNAVLSDQLRLNTARGHLSGNEATTRIPENSCVNGKTINDAVSRFTERLEGFTGRTAELAIKGQSAIDELNNAKRWAAK